MAINVAKIKEIAHKNIDMLFAALGIEYEDQGKIYFSCCPVHDESDNKHGFSYNTEENMWRCWTRECQTEFGCDIFGLVRGVLSKQQNRNVTFIDTVKWFCKILNIDDIKSDNVVSGPVITDFDILLNSFNAPIEKNEEKEGIKWASEIPSNYFIGRGFDPKTMIEFGVGDSLDNKSIMRYRSIIPIHNQDGSLVVGSIGRGTKDYIEPKFLIEKGFDKRFYLYNYHRARKRAQETSCLFIAEGQGEVWRLWESGVQNVVSLFGKELSEYQEHLIEKLGITKLVILIDHDQAGRESKIKIHRRLGRFYKLIYPKIKTNRDIGQMSPESVKEKILTDLKGLY
jgi:5S rRNA maturation endonuclease (ribonuclease M5)